MKKSNDEEVLDVQEGQVVTKNERPKKKPLKAVEPKIIMKGTRELRHDLYKAELAHYKKNVSFKYGHVDLHSVEHIHFFHSINSSGKSQKYTNACGGHFHEITTSIGPDGEMLAECGPPLQYVTRKTSKGTIRDIKPVEWYDMDTDAMKKDTHVHRVTYLNSEILTEDGQKMRRKQDAQAILSALGAKS